MKHKDIEYKDIIYQNISPFYEINKKGEVRSKKSERPVKAIFHSEDKKTIKLTCNDDMKRIFRTRELLKAVYNIDRTKYIDEDFNKNFFIKKEPFSKNEDDYATERQEEWNKIKEYMNEFKKKKDA